MEEAILVKEAVEHAGVDFLLELDFRGPVPLHGVNQLHDSGVNLGGLRLKHLLELVIGSIVYCL